MVDLGTSLSCDPDYDVVYALFGNNHDLYNVESAVKNPVNLEKYKFDINMCCFNIIYYDIHYYYYDIHC